MCVSTVVYAKPFCVCDGEGKRERGRDGDHCTLIVVQTQGREELVRFLFLSQRCWKQIKSKRVQVQTKKYTRKRLERYRIISGTGSIKCGPIIITPGQRLLTQRCEQSFLSETERDRDSEMMNINGCETEWERKITVTFHHLSGASLKRLILLQLIHF